MRVEGYGLRSETPGARTRGALNRGGVGGTQRAGPPPPRRGARARPRPRATGRTGRVGQPRGDGGSWRVAKSRGPKWRPGGRRRKAKGKERRVKRTLAANSTGGFNNGWNGRSARLPPTTGWPTYTRLGPFHPLVVDRGRESGFNAPPTPINRDSAAEMACVPRRPRPSFVGVLRCCAGV